MNEWLSGDPEKYTAPVHLLHRPTSNDSKSSEKSSGNGLPKNAKSMSVINIGVPIGAFLTISAQWRIFSRQASVFDGPILRSPRPNDGQGVFMLNGGASWQMIVAVLLNILRAEKFQTFESVKYFSCRAPGPVLVHIEPIIGRMFRSTSRFLSQPVTVYESTIMTDGSERRVEVAFSRAEYREPFLISAASPAHTHSGQQSSIA